MSKVKLLPHNQLTFEYILELSKNNKKICIPQATGTGKTWLEARILEEWSDKKAMIFAPRNEILDETCATLEDNEITNAETITYQTFNSMSDEDIINIEVDIILFDEAHRILATEWYKKVQILIESHPNSMIFGLTATPIRPDGRDIREEVFENCSTHYITLEEAIVRDIVKMPVYVSALYTFDEVVEELENKINSSRNSKEEKSELKKRLKAAKNNLELSMGVPTIIKKYITDYNGKYLVFCRDTIHLEESIPLVNKWFREAGYEGDIVNYRIGSNYSDSDDQLETFKTYNGNGLKLLFSIEKLNEGVHIPTVDGVILLRPTNSNIIYYQQIGRCIRANMEKRPIILDLVNNTNGIKISLQDGIRKCVEIRKTGGYVECSKEFEIDKYSIIDYLHETSNIFGDIENNIIKEFWTEYEDDIIREIYPIKKSNGVKEILQHRTNASIRLRAEKIGVTCDKWYDYEDEIIIKYYPSEGLNTYKRLRGKSKYTCAHRARFLGVKKEKRKISTNDISLLIDYRKLNKSYREIEKLFNNKYSQSLISQTCSELNISTSRTEAWSEEDICILKTYYPIEGKEVYKRLTGRTPDACANKASREGIQFVKNNKYKYVSYAKDKNKYHVSFMIDGKTINCGYYDDEDEAGRVAMEKAKEYGKI